MQDQCSWGNTAAKVQATMLQGQTILFRLLDMPGAISGVSTESFMKKITFQEISAEGLKNLGPVIEQLAEAELLQGHKNAVTIRLKSLKND